MPGEKVAHVYAGPMEAETIHFLECVARGQQPLVTAEHARMVMQVYQAADQSAEEGRPIEIPSYQCFSEQSPSKQAEPIKNAIADRT
jgi:predicted dehydrogenase